MRVHSAIFWVDILALRLRLIREGLKLRLALTGVEARLQAPNLLLQPHYIALHLRERVRRALQGLRI